MRALVLDSGALIALDRNDREVWAMLRLADSYRDLVIVPAGVIARVWRSGPRQARLSQALRHCDELPLDGTAARVAGKLCGLAETADVIDASVAIAAAAVAPSLPTTLLTSDPDDLRHLISALDASVLVERV